MTEASTISGLTAAEARQRLLAVGANELPSSKPVNSWNIAGKVLSEPMLLLLIACGGIYFFLGDVHEALVLLAFVFVIIGIAFFRNKKLKEL